MASQGAPKAGEAEGMPGKSDERKGPAQKGTEPGRRVHAMKITIVGRKVNLKNHFKELAEKKLSKSTASSTRTPRPPSL